MMAWNIGPFGGFFDFDGDGETDAAEEVLGLMILDEMMKEDEEEEEDD